ncbi:MAG: ISAzo13-like element transposase-related protein [Gammaproteobacteria bacterium]
MYRQCAGPQKYRHLAQTLSGDGQPISHETVAQLSLVLGCSLQGTAKTLEERQHRDGNAQFEYINRLTNDSFASAGRYLGDTKKKELLQVGVNLARRESRLASYRPRRQTHLYPAHSAGHSHTSNGRAKAWDQSVTRAARRARPGRWRLVWP